MKDLSFARSWLFVPGDSERKLAKCWSSGADAIIIDLEDSVTAGNKALARATTAQAIRKARSDGIASTIVVRINAWQTGLLEDDIAAISGAGPDGSVLRARELFARLTICRHAASLFSTIREISA